MTAAPVEGQANATLIHFLADLLQVAPSHVEIIAGQSGRDKLVTVMGMDADSVQEQILKIPAEVTPGKFYRSRSRIAEQAG